MPEPTYNDFVTGEITSSNDDELTGCINDAANANAMAAYWQGRCEGLGMAIVEMKAAHQRELDTIVGANDITIGYLKDRLNRLEVKPAGE